MAPDIYNEHYGTAVDIYAFGMCVLEMIILEKPYSECSNFSQIIFNVVNGKAPEALGRVKDPEVLEFILKCVS